MSDKLSYTVAYSSGSSNRFTISHYFFACFSFSLSSHKVFLCHTLLLSLFVEGEL
jgi:hypothetical protein